MDWQDIEDIAIALYESHPGVDPQYVRFTDLHRWVMELDGFTGNAERSNERILEAVQAAWIAEAD